jgi:hypothetical protein
MLLSDMKNLTSNSDEIIHYLQLLRLILPFLHVFISVLAKIHYILATKIIAILIYFIVLSLFYFFIFIFQICRRLMPAWPKACFRLAKARLALKLYEEAAVAAFEGCKLDDANIDLKNLLRECVAQGKEDHQRKIASGEIPIV